MESVKISVIVPVYNVEPYLEKCIDSLVHQTFREYEILLINDGSTDNSREICLKNERQYECITLFDKDNGGLSDARNYGVSKAKGEFVVFVDSDDYVEEDMLEKFWSSHEQTGADIVIGRHLEEKESEEKILEKQRTRIQVSELTAEKALEVMCYEKEFGTSAWGKMYPTSYCREISFPKGRLYEDLATVYQLIACGKKIAYLDKVFYHYIQRQGSIRNSSWNPKVMDVMVGAEELLKFYESKYPSLHKAAVQRYFFSANEVFVHAFSEKEYCKIVRPIRKKLFSCQKDMIKNRKISIVQKFRYLMMIYVPVGYKILWNILKKLKSKKGA